VTGTTDDVERLRAERDSAAARARELEMELGELRGQVKRLELMMWRRTARRRLWQSRLERVLAKVRRS
jgi:predicted  nucleic acid-binding Zn-ribbon protein